MGNLRLAIPQPALLVAAALLWTTSAHASPLDLFGFGARSPALAGTGVATASDYDAVYLNPAGLAEAEGKRLTLGLMGGFMRLYLDDSRKDVDPVSGLIIGGALRLPLGGALRDRVGFGLGFHIPFSSINRARQPLPGEPVYTLLESRAHVVAAQAALGIRIGQRASAGVGLLALAELLGTIHVTTDAAGRFTTYSEQRLVTRLTPIVGGRYALTPAWNLGLTVRGASRTDYDVAVTNDLGDALPITLPPIRIAGNSQYDPLTVAAEAAHTMPGWLFLGQLAYQRWSAYPAPTLPPLANGMTEDPGFRDIVIPRVAAEHRRMHRGAELSGRAGYAFVLSPAPEMNERESLLDNHRHILSAGLGIGLPWLAAAAGQRPLSLDLWGQLHILAPRHHEKDPGAYEPDEELPFTEIDTGGAIWAGGFSLGVEL